MLIPPSPPNPRIQLELALSVIQDHISMVGGAWPPPHPLRISCRGGLRPPPPQTPHLNFMRSFAPQTPIGNPGQARPGPGPELGLCKVYVFYAILAGSLFGGGYFHWRFLAAREAWQFLTNCQIILVFCNSERV